MSQRTKELLLPNELTPLKLQQLPMTIDGPARQPAKYIPPKSDKDLIAAYLAKHKPKRTPAVVPVYEPYDGRLLPTNTLDGSDRSKQFTGISMDENNRFYGN